MCPGLDWGRAIWFCILLTTPCPWEAVLRLQEIEDKKAQTKKCNLTSLDIIFHICYSVFLRWCFLLLLPMIVRRPCQELTKTLATEQRSGMTRMVGTALSKSFEISESNLAIWPWVRWRSFLLQLPGSTNARPGCSKKLHPHSIVSESIRYKNHSALFPMITFNHFLSETRHTSWKHIKHG